MALPTLSRTWQMNVNQLIPSASAVYHCANILYNIKESLIGFPSNPWVVDASSNGSTFVNVGGANPDTWTSVSVVSSGFTSQNSWIVLRQPVTGFSLCFQSTGDYYPFQGYLYGAGVTFNANGTKTTAPTATGRQTQISNTYWGGDGASVYSYLHVLHSEDGEATRIFMCRGNMIVGFWMVERPLNTPVFWTDSSVFRAKGSSESTPSNQLTVSNLRDNASSAWANGGTTQSAYYASEVGGGVSLYDILVNGDEDDVNVGFPFIPMPVAVTTDGLRGMRGYASDMWWGSSGRGTSTTYPEDGSRQFVQLGSVIVPWNGSSPRTA